MYFHQYLLLINLLIILGNLFLNFNYLFIKLVNHYYIFLRSFLTSQSVNFQQSTYYFIHFMELNF